MRTWMRLSLSGLAAAAALALVLVPSGYLNPAFASAAAYLAPFDGNPPKPLPAAPTGWDVTFVGDPQPMEAQHGADCGAPPATHHVASLEDMVFECKGHIMTAINAGYGAIYLTPNQMLDFSQGEAVFKWDMSTLRTSSRDWVDVVIMPYDENVQLSFENNDQHLPKDAVHLELVGPNVFVPSIWRNGQKEVVQSDTYHTWDMILANAGLMPDAARRDTFELRLSRTHLKFGMPGYNFSWVDTDIVPLNWNQAVVQLNHRTYNPNKACNFDGSCGPNTWHWDNVSVSPADPFTILRGDRRMVDAATTNQVNFATPAPANAMLRFVGVGVPIQYSVDGGATWQDAQTQGESVGKNHPEIPDNFWTPIPAGTANVRFRGQGHGSVGWEVSDISYWVPSASATPIPPTAIVDQPLAHADAPAQPQAPAQAQPAAQAAVRELAPPPASDGSPTTLSFDDLSATDQAFSGQYPPNVIDWGTGAWWLASPYAQFTSNSFSFNGDGPTSATFTFVSPRGLVQLDADNGGKADSSVSLSCDGQPPVEVSLPAGQITTIKTGWTDACSTVTVTSANGWYTNFDNIQIQ
jgi:hypothetical protein